MSFWGSCLFCFGICCVCVFLRQLFGLFCFSFVLYFSLGLLLWFLFDFMCLFGTVVCFVFVRVCVSFWDGCFGFVLCVF